MRSNRTGCDQALLARRQQTSMCCASTQPKYPCGATHKKCMPDRKNQVTGVTRPCTPLGCEIAARQGLCRSWCTQQHADLGDDETSGRLVMGLRTAGKQNVQQPATPIQHSSSSMRGTMLGATDGTRRDLGLALSWKMNAAAPAQSSTKQTQRAMCMQQRGNPSARRST